MAQSYLIFVQGRKIEIRERASSEKLMRYGNQEKILAENDYPKIVLPALKKLEEGKIQSLAFFTPDAKNLFENLKTCYDKFIIAAGGLVKNRRGDVLVIFRNGKWDLPKGKVERNERTDEGALREVREETGLTNLQLLSEFYRTYHTYQQDEKRILKETVWHLMQHTANEPIRPQQSEGITAAEWIDRAQAEKVYANTHDNILLLMKEFFSREKS